MDWLRLALWGASRQVSSFDAESYRRHVAGERALPVSSTNRLDEVSRTGDVVFSFIIAHSGDSVDLRRTLDSLHGNRPADAEIIVATIPAHESGVSKISEEYGSQSPIRTVIFDGNIAEVEAEALRVALGSFVTFLSTGDVLAPSAIAHVVYLLEREPKLDLIYGDEDWIDGDRRRSRPRFKTQWDPYAQFGFDQPGRLCVMRKKRVEQVRGLRPQFYPAQHYDLHLRLGEIVRPSAIRHTPHVLYHRQEPLMVTAENVATALSRYAVAARKAVSAATGAEVRPSPLAPFVNRVVWPLPEPAPLVSIVVPTRDRAELVRNCARGVLHETDYPALELLILDNDSVEAPTFELFATLEQDPRVRIEKISGPFNYSLINNIGAARARGDILVLMNNDTEVIRPGWLREMVALAIRPDVGCVGAKLLYANRTIQHAGVILQPGLAMHAFRGRRADELGYDAQLAGVRCFTAVTAACLALRKQLFLDVGGFDAEHLRIAYNDVDLCLKVEERGYLNLCTPFEPLFHLENASRGANVTPEKQALDAFEYSCLAARWPDSFKCDPYSHPAIRYSWNGHEQLIAG